MSVQLPPKIREDLPYYDKLVKDNGYYQVIQKNIYNIINGDEYECEDSLIGQYVDSLFANLTEEEEAAFSTLNANFVSFWPIFALLNFNATSTDFYPDDQQSKRYNKALNDANAFWDTKSEDIEIAAWTTKLILDEPETMVLVIQSLNGFSEDEEGLAQAQAIYNESIAIMQEYPAVGFDFPLHTLNAVAISGTKNLIVMGKCLSLPNRTVSCLNSLIILHFMPNIGDGIYNFLVEYLGMGTAGPEYVFFHEFGHHVQFGNEIPEFDKFYAARTRYIELLADALAAYYGHHPRGAAFQTKRVLDMTEAAFGVGDCGFTSAGHHGTPNQRARAVQYATDLIDNSRAKGNIMPSAEFIERFQAAYDDIIAPEFPIECPECGPPTNDECEHATLLNGILYEGAIGVVSGSNRYATLDENAETCNDLEVTGPGVWYTIVGNGNNITLDTCRDATDFDTIISVYEGGCDTPMCVASDDDIDPFSGCSSVTWESEDGTPYDILVHGYYLDPVGDFTMKILAGDVDFQCDGSCGTCNVVRPDEAGCSCESCQIAVCIDNPSCCNIGWSPSCVESALAICSCEPPLPPSNDFCEGAEVVSGIGSLSSYTNFATWDFGPFCDTNFPAPSVWYSIVGTGGDITFDTCGLGTNYDSVLYVYSGSCTDLTCVVANDDNPVCSVDGIYSTKSSVTWTSEMGTTYYVLVKGWLFRSGEFELSWTS